MTLRLVPLQKEHRPLFAGFRNQHKSLAEYLSRYALRHLLRDMLGRTYLAIDALDSGERIAGYFTLSASSVERRAVSSLPVLDRLPGFPIPAVLLARLAVDERAQGQGVGRYLFEQALGLTLQLAAEGPLGFRLLVTDAIDEKAARFYEHFGLARLSGAFPCRMVLDLAPLSGR